MFRREFHPKFRCVQFGCDDMFAGVGGWMECCTWIEFPEGSRKVNRFQVLLLFGSFEWYAGHTMSSSEMFNILLGVSALHYSTGSTEGSEFGVGFQLMRCA